MRFLFVSLFLFYFSYGLHAQKKSLTESSALSWPRITPLKITSDGSYFVYRISSAETGPSLIAKATDTSWSIQFPHAGGDDAIFTRDSRRLIFTKTGDSLNILSLGGVSPKYLGRIISFKTPSKGQGEWLGYILNDSTNDFILRNLNSGISKRYPGVDDYVFNNQGSRLVLSVKAKESDFQGRKLLWVNLENGEEAILGRNYKANQFTFDSSGQRLAFLSEEDGNAGITSKIRYFKPGMNSARLLVNASLPGMGTMRVSNNELSFSNQGDKLFFYIEKFPDKSTINDTVAKLDLWNYGDELVQFPVHCNYFLSVIHLDKPDKIIRLQRNEDRTYYMQLNGAGNDNYVLFTSNLIGNGAEYKWRTSARPDIYLVSTDDGSKKRLRNRCLLGSNPKFSTDGKYVIWYENPQQEWFTYNITSGAIRNISQKTGAVFYEEDDHPDFPDPAGVAAWLKEDKAVWIYDRNDIWQLDPDGVKTPVNITREYGSKNHIRLRLMDFNGETPAAITPSDTLLLSGLDLISKSNGFFRLIANKVFQIHSLSTDSEVIYFPYRYSSPDLSGVQDPFFPIKAQNTNRYVVERMSSTEYPNLYFTSDFIKFKPLTNLAPQKQYNWYHSELVHWGLANGRSMEGILYKPENFDPARKYPVIFYYYQRHADALNLFIHPELSNGMMNIPWYVSNGYLVFVPDIIFYRLGHPGDCVYQSVISAARYLSEKPWVDAKKMGLQGHSFGGWETNYIVTRTSIFSAAAPAEGLSNLISAYNHSIDGRGGGWYYEVRQGRIGSSLWEHPELFIENSPVFRATNVNTPVLILHNKTDHVVPFQQGEEWYNALHRLDKKVWLLSYDGEDHTLMTEQNQLDYSVRLSQFFGYYLKNQAAPIWMTKGIIPSQKGIESGLLPDTSGATP